MASKTPQQLVESIIKSGLTQVAIAKKAKITQATVSRIADGKHKDPKSSTIDALRRLAAKRAA